MNTKKNIAVSIQTERAQSTSWLRDFAQLIKLRLNLTVVFSAVMAYLIAAGSNAEWITLLILGIGGFCLTAAANALNEVLEIDLDKMMKRTANRPLPSGRMKTTEAVLIAGIMAVIGLTLLSILSPLSGLLGSISIVLYAFVYTPLKRYSSLAVLVGAIPGALPILIGTTAFEGSISTLAIILFSIQFFWQFPHFWAIAYLGDEDYKNAGFKLLPTVESKKNQNVGSFSTILAACLIPCAIFLFFNGNIGWIGLILITMYNLGYVYGGIHLYQNNNEKAAKRLLFASLAYIPVVLLTIYFLG